MGETGDSWDDYPRQLALDNYKRLYLIEKQVVAKDAEIERLQGGVGYLLERSGHKPCTRLDLSNIAGRILAGEDVYSYRLEAKQDV